MSKFRKMTDIMEKKIKSVPLGKGGHDSNTTKTYLQEIFLFKNYIENPLEYKHNFKNRLDPKLYNEAISSYIEYLKEKNYAPATIKKKLNALCFGLDISSSAFKNIRPKVHAGEQTKGRNGLSECRKSLEDSRLKKVADYIGCRLDEYGRLRGRDLYIRDDGRYQVIVRRSKGGQRNVPYIVPKEHEEEVKDFFYSVGYDDYVLSKKEKQQAKHMNLHENRRNYALARYNEFVNGTPEEKLWMLQFMYERFMSNQKKGDSAFKEMMNKCKKSRYYICKGSIRADMIRQGKPIKYERLGLFYASLCTAHYRENIIVQHYLR